jgi:Icc-related predicted phosphoesterase/uncharacterized protein YprB with RNaseH-like and TPR domain
LRILAFSDWRVQDPQDAVQYVKALREPVDIIAYAGDDLMRFERRDVNYFSELARLCRAGVLLAVAGNDDTSEQKVVLSKQNVWDLCKQPFIYGDTAFLGVEGSTRGPGCLQHTEYEVKKHLNAQGRQVKGKEIVIVSHPPPYGVLDEGIRFAEFDKGSYHIGSLSLRNYVESNPFVKLVICGHCHSQGGREMRFKDASVVNVASHDSPGAEGRFALINYDPSTEPLTVNWDSTLSLIPPDSVRNLHRVGSIRWHRLGEAGIQTITDLVQCPDLRTLSFRTGISGRMLSKLRLEAQAQLDGKMKQIAPWDLRLDDPMFLDIETDLSWKRVWLVGVLWRGKFHQFYSDTWAGEKSMLKEFLRFLAQNRPSVLVSYSCSNFDYRILKDALVRCGLDCRLLSSIPHVDLGIEIKRRLIFPMKRYTLKDISRYFGYRFAHEDLNGFMVAFEYIKHLEEKRPLDRRVLEYNKDDVQSIEHVVRMLERTRLAPTLP